MSNDFYKALEDKFRGSRELIKSRLQIYKPFITSISSCYPYARTLDLGCGRGEWLEMASEAGFSAHGVDLDEHMLEAGVERGLDVQIADAITFIKQLPDQSHAIISAFHLVEHLPFTDLHIIVEEALRVLLPGGLLIMETPNPENIVVGSSNFYMDPTHNRPLPPKLLAFLPEYYGFEKVKILRLQEFGAVQTANALNLNDVFYSVSNDYAVIARKTAPPDTLCLTNQAFETDSGTTLEQVIFLYTQQQHNAMIAAIHHEIKANQFLRRVKKYCQHKFQNKQLSTLCSLYKKVLKKNLIRLIKKAITYSPLLKRLAQKLKRALIKKNIAHASITNDLLPRERQIYSDLQVAIEKNKRNNE